MQPITGNNPKIAKAQSCSFVAPVLTTLLILFRTEYLSTYKNKKSICLSILSLIYLANAYAIFSCTNVRVYNANINKKMIYTKKRGSVKTKPLGVIKNSHYDV